MTVSGEFAVAVSHGRTEVVVSVRGEVDLVTAPTLGHVLIGLVAEDHLNLVLDLADLSFMDAAGLGVVAAAAGRLAESNEVLTVRSAPPLTRWILEVTGLSERLRIEAPDASAATLGVEQRPDDESQAVDGGSAGLIADVARRGSMPASNAVIDAALRLVTQLTDATIEGADGVSVSLERHGRMTTVASTNETVRRMDLHQYETGEGPCLAAAADGHWFHVPSLEAEERWPAFVPRAIEDGIASILSTPLLVVDRPVGALNIYSSSDGAFGAPQQELAALFASQASAILVDADASITDEETGQRILGALTARTVIARAQGVIMVRRALSSDDADAVLHRTARADGLTVLEAAAGILATIPSTAESEKAGVHDQAP